MLSRVVSRALSKLPRDMHLVFTCKVCETRSVKGMSKQAYNEGVVICRCPGCQKLHLIADNLNYFGQKRNLEDILGQPIETITDVAEFSPAKIIGEEKLTQLQLEDRSLASQS
jgi:protein import protein ZIM17